MICLWKDRKALFSREKFVWFFPFIPEIRRKMTLCRGSCLGLRIESALGRCSGLVDGSSGSCYLRHISRNAGIPHSYTVYMLRVGCSGLVGNTHPCGAKDPRFESRCGQKFVLSRKSLQYAALGTGCTFNAVPRSTQPSTLRGTTIFEPLQIVIRNCCNWFGNRPNFSNRLYHSKCCVTSVSCATSPEMRKV